MNQYGAQARRHWQTHLPNRYRQIEDPETFFADLGEQIAQQVQDRAAAIAGSDPEQETYLEKVGRLNMARQTAESGVMREVLPAPTTDLSPTQ
jgi:hypothetical protein